MVTFGFHLNPFFIFLYGCTKHQTIIFKKILHKYSKENNKHYIQCRKTHEKKKTIRFLKGQSHGHTVIFEGLKMTFRKKKLLR